MIFLHVLRRYWHLVNKRFGGAPPRITMRPELRERLTSAGDDFIAAIHGDYFRGSPLVFDSRLPVGQLEFDLLDGRIFHVSMATATIKHSAVGQPPTHHWPADARAFIDKKGDIMQVNGEWVAVEEKKAEPPWSEAAQKRLHEKRAAEPNYAMCSRDRTDAAMRWNDSQFAAQIARFTAAPVAATKPSIAGLTRIQEAGYRMGTGFVL